MRALFLQALIVQMIIRLYLVLQYPHNYAFDGFQRWAGRDHLLIRDWLPATQSFIYLNHQLGFGIIGAKLLLSLLGAIAVASSCLIAAHLYGKQSGRLFIAVGCFAPFLTWSSTLYQEGTFLCFSASAIALAIHSKRWIWMADILAGAVALCRYEGWPFVILYLCWRRERSALLCLWGIMVWLTVKWTGISGHQPSPISYADWEGLQQRFSWQEYGKDCWKFLRNASYNGAIWVWLGALIAIPRAWKKDAFLTALLLLLTLSQFAAVLGWIAGLETAILRMLVVPTFFLGIFCVGVGQHSRWHIAVALMAMLFWLYASNYHIHRDTRYFRPERNLVKKIEDCGDCIFLITPRKGMGTRDRHDGCEIILGVSELRYTKDIYCSTWPNDDFERQPTHTAVWQPKKKYYITKEIQ